MSKNCPPQNTSSAPLGKDRMGFLRSLPGLIFYDPVIPASLRLTLLICSLLALGTYKITFQVILKLFFFKMYHEISTFLTDNTVSWAGLYIERDQKNSIKDEKRRKWTYMTQGFYIFHEVIKY